MSPTVLMTKKISKTLTTLMAVMIFLVSCFGVKEDNVAEVTPLGSYSEAYLLLNSERVTQLSEATELTTDSDSGPVTIAYYYPKKNALMAVYEDGFLRTWDVNNAEILLEHDLGIASAIGVGLDRYGDLVMGAVQHIVKENHHGELTNYIGGITIWNTETGEVVECVIYPCERATTLEQGQAHLIGTTLDPKGRWALVNYGTLIGINDITGTKSSYSFSVRSYSNDTYGEMSLFAFDPSDDRYAIAFRDGTVRILNDGISSDWFNSDIIVGAFEKDSQSEVEALSFSPDGQSLARLQDGILSIWKVSARNGALYSEFSIPNGKTLAFDQSSELLFVGTNGKINVLDIEKKQLIREFATPEITSLAISSDNRLLIWGDKLGAIHLWGVRE